MMMLRDLYYNNTNRPINVTYQVYMCVQKFRKFCLSQLVFLYTREIVYVYINTIKETICSQHKIQTFNHEVKISWSGFDDIDSDVNHYWVALGSFYGRDDYSAFEAIETGDDDTPVTVSVCT